MEPITGAAFDDQVQEVMSAALHGEPGQLSGVQSFRTGSVSIFAAASKVTDWHYVVYTPASQIAGSTSPTGRPPEPS